MSQIRESQKRPTFGRLSSQAGLVIQVALGLAVVMMISTLAIYQGATNMGDDLKKREATAVIEALALRTMTMIENGEAWRRTLTSGQSTFACLSGDNSAGDFEDSSQCTNVCLVQTSGLLAETGCSVASQRSFNLHDPQGNVFVNSGSSTSGFNLAGQPCTTFNASSGNDDCPIRLELKWAPVCPGSYLVEPGVDAPCYRPEIFVSGKFTYKPASARLNTPINMDTQLTSKQRTFRNFQYIRGQFYDPGVNVVKTPYQQNLGFEITGSTVSAASAVTGGALPGQPEICDANGNWNSPYLSTRNRRPLNRIKSDIGQNVVSINEATRSFKVRAGSYYCTITAASSGIGNSKFRLIDIRNNELTTNFSAQVETYNNAVAAYNTALSAYNAEVARFDREEDECADWVSQDTTNLSCLSGSNALFAGPQCLAAPGSEACFAEWMGTPPAMWATSMPCPSGWNTKFGNGTWACDASNYVANCACNQWSCLRISPPSSMTVTGPDGCPAGYAEVCSDPVANKCRGCRDNCWAPQSTFVQNYRTANSCAAPPTRPHPCPPTPVTLTEPEEPLALNISFNGRNDYVLQSLPMKAANPGSVVTSVASGYFVLYRETDLAIGQVCLAPPVANQALFGFARSGTGQWPTITAGGSYKIPTTELDTFTTIQCKRLF